MKLLVKRDPSLLVVSDGEYEGENVPDKLKQVHVVHPNHVTKLMKRENDDLLICDDKDYHLIRQHLNDNSSRLFNPAIWSGYRSVLVSSDNQLYRLKGVSLDPRNPDIREVGDEFFVFGGQPKYSAEFEKRMSDRFNEILKERGIKPVMQCKGFWNYPTEVKGEKYSASVIEVRGDTRLDELMFTLENFFFNRLNRKNDLNGNGEKLAVTISNLYKDMGYIVGRMKRIMDSGNQTWSSVETRSNAHVGNVVLCPENGKVSLGFVDFDASCDVSQFERWKLMKMQKQEYEAVKASALKGPISIRPIKGQFFSFQNLGTPGEITHICYRPFREAFVQGYEQGFDLRNFYSEFTNEIDSERFLEIFLTLRENIPLVPQTATSVSIPSLNGLERSIVYKGNYSIFNDEEEISNFYDILRRNKDYETSLISYNPRETIIYNKEIKSEDNRRRKHKGLEKDLEKYSNFFVGSNKKYDETGLVCLTKYI